MPTPHISAAEGDFAELVLLPGDPLRARWIAETFLDDAVQVTGVRNMLGYTGTYRDEPVSVMGTGMGVPSITIYATELVRHYGCRRLVRVGSCGAVQGDVGLRDLVVALGASTDSSVNRQRSGGIDLAAIADFDMTCAVVELARARATGDGPVVHVGNVLTSDLFYAPRTADDPYLLVTGLGILGVEMEAAGLYGVAAQEGARALAVCTVTDHLDTDEHLSSDERQRTLAAMVELTLDALVSPEPPETNRDV